MGKRITEKEYLEALLIINNYLMQIKNDVSNLDNDFSRNNPFKTKTLISDWLNKFRNMGTTGINGEARIYHHLKAYSDNGSEFYYNRKKHLYIEDLNKKEFCRIRNLGAKSYNDFILLRDLVK